METMWADSSMSDDRRSLGETLRGRRCVLSYIFNLGDGVHLELIRIDEGDDTYFLGRFPLTQEQYKAVTGEDLSSYDRFSDSAAHFAHEVSWDEAITFCAKLNERFGQLLPEKYVFAPPTWTQLVKATRAGQDTAYSSGNDYDEAHWNGGNSDRPTHAAGKKKGNAWGFHDMSEDASAWWYRDEVNKGVTCPVSSEACDEWGGQYRWGYRGFRVAAEPAEAAARRYAEAEKAERGRMGKLDEAFLEIEKTGRGRRIDLGEGVVLDLIRVGEGADAYFLGRFPVVQGLYKAVMGVNPSSHGDGDPDRANLHQFTKKAGFAFARSAFFVGGEESRVAALATLGCTTPRRRRKPRKPARDGVHRVAKERAVGLSSLRSVVPLRGERARPEGPPTQPLREEGEPYGCPTATLRCVPAKHVGEGAGPPRNELNK